MEKYHVKGFWSVEGIFNGALYCNGKKFGTVVRVQMDKIAVSPSIGKDEMNQRFKRWLIENKVKRHAYLTEEIGQYIIDHPEKKVKLV